nr:transposase [Phyllobacterium endophyticum]
MRDRLGTIFTDAQFDENLSDHRAADAVRSRIDWKYLLGLELTDPGFDASILSEFRGGLVAGGAEEHLLDTILTLCRDLKLVSARVDSAPARPMCSGRTAL